MRLAAVNACVRVLFEDAASCRSSTYTGARARAERNGRGRFWKKHWARGREFGC